MYWSRVAQKSLNLIFGVFAVGVFIYAIIVAKAVGDINYSDFSVLTFLGVLIGGELSVFISAAFFGLIVEAVMHLENIEYHLKYNDTNSKQDTSSSINNSKLSLTGLGSSNIKSSKQWICKKCNTKNLDTQIFCKDCGTHK